MKSCRVYAFVIVLLALATTASAEAGRWGLGVGALDGDFNAQLRKDFWLGGDVSQITGQVGMTFRSKATFRADADYHFIIKEGKSRFYPLAGIDFAFNSDSAKFGINGGGGLKFRLTEKLNGFGEAKYVFGSWDGWSFVGGVYF